jgi:galactose mutarotase-like enzyme
VTQVVVFSGAPGWVCVEPVTMANNGFELSDAGMNGTGVIVLAPGEATAVSYRFEWLM